MNCSVCNSEIIITADSITCCPCCGLVIEKTTKKTMEETINKTLTFRELVDRYETMGEYL